MGFPELLLRKIAVEPHFADRRFLLAQGNETERDGTDTHILPGDAPSGMLTPRFQDHRPSGVAAGAFLGSGGITSRTVERQS
jgi:hypothetical protein